MRSVRYDDIKHYKSEAIKAANDFGYGEEVIKLIEKSESQNEISKIMQKARKG